MTTKKKRLKKEDKHYINNKDFLAEMIISVEKQELTPEAINMIMILANRLATTQFYYVFEDDRYTCMSQGIEDCLRYWKNFNPEKYDNPFSYFTMMILNGMKRQFNQLYPISASKRISLSNESNVFNL
jgi:hypothetical protein